MHLPAWKPDLIILNSGGSGTYKQRAGDSGAVGGSGAGGREGRAVLLHGCMVREINLLISCYHNLISRLHMLGTH